VAVPRPTGRDTLRSAALAVLAAWNDAQGEHAGLAEAIEQLRQALANSGVARTAPGPRPPRTGTKQAAVLALLRRPEGANGPQIVAATGWAPHTVRGFLAALKKRGVAVLVHERVRQVGPSKAGAKGSYSIYRIAEAG
jgi:predicted ArsR family transcriptional regulator